MQTIQEYEPQLCKVCEENFTTKTLECEVVGSKEMRSFPCCLACRDKTLRALENAKEDIQTINNMTIKSALPDGRRAREAQVMPPMHRDIKLGKAGGRTYTPPTVDEDSYSLADALAMLE